jgi:hypothetical protein
MMSSESILFLLNSATPRLHEKHRLNAYPRRAMVVKREVDIDHGHPIDSIVSMFH